MLYFVLFCLATSLRGLYFSEQETEESRYRETRGYGELVEVEGMEIVDKRDCIKEEYIFKKSKIYFLKTHVTMPGLYLCF